VIIYGIDPGPKESALVGVEFGEPVKITRCEILPNGELLELLRGIYYGGVTAIEWLSYYGPTTSAGSETFATCFWVGRFFSVAGIARHPLLIERREVRLSLVGTPRAGDPEVRRALIERLGDKGTKKSPGPLHGITSHAWAALAVAVCAHDHLLGVPGCAKVANGGVLCES
jgi:hypothetical protein